MQLPQFTVDAGRLFALGRSRLDLARVDLARVDPERLESRTVGISRPASHPRQCLGTAENPGQRVVVGRGNRIELVVVASRTSNRQCKDRPARRIDLVVHLVHQVLLIVPLVDALGTQRQETGRHNPLDGLPRTVRLHQVSGNLLADKLIVRLIHVEGVDYIIAISPGLGERDVAFLARRFRIAGHVQPVPTPAFAKLGRFEQAIDHFLECLWRIIAGKRFDFVRRRRQPAEGIRRAANQREAVRVFHRSQPCLFQPRQDEVVDIVTGPRRVTHGGRFGCPHRLKGPEFPTFGQVDRGPRHALAVARIGRSQLDPLDEVGNHRLGQLTVRRHLERFVPQRLDQQTAVGTARHDGRPRLAALQDTRSRVEPQAALDFRFHRMALVTVLF